MTDNQLNLQVILATLMNLPILVHPIKRLVELGQWHCVGDERGYRHHRV